MEDFWLKPDLLVLSGSHLYGCAVPESDNDTRGFVVEPAQYLIGRKTWEMHEIKPKKPPAPPGPDHVVWGFRKFIKLLEGFSPNTIEIIFAPEKNILECTDAGRMVIDHRHLFLAKGLVSPMQGFALSEWKKAMNPDGSQLGEQRKEHIGEFGYSVKNAYHAIRLLEECIEFLETGTITFPRPNADFLRKVRHGFIPKQEVMERWADLDAMVVDAKEKSPLPDELDKDKVDKLYYDVIEDKLKNFVAEQYGATVQ